MKANRLFSRRLLLPTIVLLLIVMINLLLVIFLVFPENRTEQEPFGSEETSQAAETTDPPITFPDLGTFPPPDNLPDALDNLTYFPLPHADVHLLSNTPIAITAINRPLFTGGDPEATAAINAALEAYCIEFATLTDSDRIEAEEDYNNAQAGNYSFETHERNADYTVYIKDRILSVLFRIYRRSGGANMLSEYKAFAFDVTTGLPITFSDVIGRDDAFAKNYIVCVFSQFIDRDPENFFSDAKDFLALGNHLSDFYLTEEALVLFLNTNVISPMALGPQSISVPYEKIGH